MARFFQIFAVIDEIGAYDLLYHRYGCIPDIGFAPLCRLINKAREENQREELYSAWLAQIPSMQSGDTKFTSFKAYYDHCTGKDIDNRSAEEIIAEAEQAKREVLGEA